MVRRLQTLIPNVDDLLELEVEELAGYLLKALCEPGQVHLHNFLNGLDQLDEVYPRQRTKEIKRAIGAAWYWLRGNALIAGEGGEWEFVTDRGRELADGNRFNEFLEARIFSRESLHVKLCGNAWRNYIRANYDTAVFEAFKAIEEAVREASGLDSRDIGISLMRKAFKPDGGPLTDGSVVVAERQALADLFAGAIGSYKNPVSHRTVAITDSREAGEMLLLASHLLRIVDARTAT